jgi:hypothetical protein
LGSRIEETRKKVDRLVDAVADGGSGFQAIRSKLTLEERDLRLLEHDLARVKTEIDRMAGEPLDAERLRQVLKDFDALFAVANDDEHDGAFSSVNLGATSSNFRAFWLRRRVSNPRPGG